MNDICIYPDDMCFCSSCEGFLAFASIIEDEYKTTQPVHHNLTIK